VGSIGRMESARRRSYAVIYDGLMPLYAYRIEALFKIDKGKTSLEPVTYEVIMKKSLLTLGVVALLGGAPVMGLNHTAQAGNIGVETTLQSYGDLSVFYQALLNTGVINELSEDEHYTIFAPTNAAFAQIRQQTYPCFYQYECRPQIAVLLRNHIVEGRYDLRNLTSYGQGVRTAGNHVVHVNEQYVNDYAVDNHKILSKTEAGGNVVYRVDGLITNPQELAQFRTAVAVVPASNVVTTERTTYRKTYSAPYYDPNYSAYQPPAGIIPEDDTQTTVITHTYTTEQ